MAARSKARQRALQILFEADQRGSAPTDVLADWIRLARTDDRHPPVSEYTMTLVEGYAAHAERIDELAAATRHMEFFVFPYSDDVIFKSLHPVLVEDPGRPAKEAIEDAEAIRSSMQNGRRAVIVGAGFIGLEVAAACREKGLEVTVVEALGHPWARYASAETGAFLAAVFFGNAKQEAGVYRHPAFAAIGER